MDMYKEWELLNEKLYNNQSLRTEEIMDAIVSESRTVIQEIKKGLTIKSNWVLGFIVLFTLLMFFFRDTTQAVVSIGIINFIYVISFIFIKLETKRINSDFLKNDNVLKCLQSNANIIKRAFLFENLVFLLNALLIIVYSMIWVQLKTGRTFNALLHDSRFLILVIVICIIIVPLGLFISKSMNKKAFGPYLNKLNDNINKLQGVE